MFDTEKYAKELKKLKNPTESDIRRAIRNAKGIPGVTKTISDSTRVIEILDKCGKVLDVVVVS